MHIFLKNYISVVEGLVVVAGYLGYFSLFYFAIFEFFLIVSIFLQMHLKAWVPKNVFSSASKILFYSERSEI